MTDIDPPIHKGKPTVCRKCGDQTWRLPSHYSYTDPYNDSDVTVFCKCLGCNHCTPCYRLALAENGW